VDNPVLPGSPEDVPARPAGTGAAGGGRRTPRRRAPARSEVRLERGLTVQRRFTHGGVHPFDEVQWERRTATIANEKGETVFEQRDVEVPAFWSQMATNVVVSKYFRGPLGSPRRETSVKQVISRVCDTIANMGREGGYFTTEADAQVFQDELNHLVLHQMMAFNSPVWFNVGVPGTKAQASACQPYDALVSTPRGMVPIGTLVEESRVGEEVYDAEGVTTIVAVKANGRKPVRRVRLRNGSFIEATPDHVVLVERSWRDGPRWLRVDQLEPGMRLHLHPHRARMAQSVAVAAAVGGGVWQAPVPTSDFFAGDGQDEAAVSEAALAGWLQADGFVGQYTYGSNRSVTIEFQMADEDELAWVMGHLARALPDVHYNISKVPSRDPSKAGTIACWRIRLYGEVLRPFVDRWGLWARGTKMRVPERLWTAGYEEVVAYLRSIFQADGYVTVRVNDYQQGSVGFAVISERWTEEVQVLLSSVGIYSRRYRAVGKRLDRHDQYVLKIGIGSERARFAEMIGFVSRRKQKLLLESLDLRNIKACSDIRAESIVAIDDVGTQEVFDIQTGSGNYLSNNIVVHNCFINSVEDTMDSILRLAHTEGMLFKYGSGTGTNLSPIRSSHEALAGGGTASGPVSFMRGFDAFAGVIKSGGTTRRAAKMVILNADHPDVEEFITCKVTEERKAWALIEAGYDSAFTGEAYASIFFQNSNNSVRVTDDFMRAVVDDREWQLRAVTDPERIIKTLPARELLRLMAECAWQCGDPGIQYDTTINDWHTSPNSGRINASNPCFPGHVRVHTTVGLVPISQLYRRMADGEEIRVYTHRATAHEPGEGVAATLPLALMKTGTKPVVRLLFSDGRELRCTPNHRLWTTNRGWVHAQDLIRTDEVLLNDSPTPATDASWALPVKVAAPAISWNRGGTKVYGEIPDRWSTDLGELTGHLIGAGCMTDAQTVWVYGGEDVRDGVCDRHEEMLRELLGGCSRVETANRTTQLRLGSGAVRELFAGLGVSASRAHQKRIPQTIFTAPSEVQIAFLRGLFSADGCVYGGKTNRYVSLGSCSRDLLADVQTLLTSFGIRSCIYEITSTHPSRFTYRSKGGESVTYVPRRMFDLRIPPSDMAYFAARVGFSAPRKQRSLEDLLGRVRTHASRPTVHLVALVPDGVETVYNLTEPLHHSYIVEGMVVANCSEYLFLDDSACNLASLNLIKFLREDGTFDIDAYRHAIHLTITAQEILVSNASYPTPKIADNSEKFRPLGLGYANLGAVLMARGVPYDSPHGRDLAAALTAILTGEAYTQSARVAREIGPFSGFSVNRQPMLRVIGKHREAAYRIPDTSIEPELVQSARRAWDEAHELGAMWGYRNAQATVLAPTGTIAFLLDCDTTGVEPDIALVKYKKLVGGGMLKMVNNTVPLALRRLGYGEKAVNDIVAHIDTHDTIEGAPHLREEDLAVFDCAFKPANGVRSIAWQGHIRMMSATQPFLSGAISKTVNLPQEATVEDVEQAYLDGWTLGLKALAIYRDGSKRSQPLATTIEKTTGAALPAKPVERPLRRRLPAERQALTHKFEIAGHEGYITVGLYEDGSVGEIFLKMAKEGSTISGLMDAFATAISMALQYGVPLKALVGKFTHTRFEPSGFTGNPEIPIAKSIMDYIFRWLASRFLPWEDRDALGIVRRDGTEPGEEPAVDTRITPAAASVSTAPPPAGPRPASPAPVAFLNQEDAPSCADCGSLMVRSGACYKCLNCGATSGCS